MIILCNAAITVIVIPVCVCLEHIFSSFFFLFLGFVFLFFLFGGVSSFVFFSFYLLVRYLRYCLVDNNNHHVR